MKAELSGLNPRIDTVEVKGESATMDVHELSNDFDELEGCMYDPPEPEPQLQVEGKESEKMEKGGVGGEEDQEM